MITQSDIDNSKDEENVLLRLGFAWDGYLKLPWSCQDDQDDFRHHIHACQNIVLARLGKRALEASDAKPTS